MSQECENTENSHFLVIGAGQMRTNTMRLKYALEILYPNQKCYHMVNILQDHHNHVTKWTQALEKSQLTRELADEIYQGYTMTSGVPSNIFYQDLIKLYPNAKVILTIRDVDTWLNSAKTIILKKQPLFIRFINYFSNFQRSFAIFKERILKYTYGHTSDELLNDDELLKHGYEDLNRNIIEYVPSSKLLILCDDDGWDKLCKFLDVPIPSQPYPSITSDDEYFKRNFYEYIMIYFIYAAILLILIAVLIQIS